MSGKVAFQRGSPFRRWVCRPTRELGTILLIVLFSTGCASTIRLSPTLPNSTGLGESKTRTGVYMTSGIQEKVEAPSGIWPGTTYKFNLGSEIQEDLTSLTKRHFRAAGPAENAGDKRWDYVIEYQLQKPVVAGDDFRSSVPVLLVMRDPQTGRDVNSLTLTGEGSPQGGKVLRLFFGRLAEKRALERTLTEAYTNLYKSVDGNLARLSANRAAPAPPDRPYQRRR